MTKPTTALEQMQIRSDYFGKQYIDSKGSDKFAAGRQSGLADAIGILEAALATPAEPVCDKNTGNGGCWEDLLGYKCYEHPGGTFK